MPCGMPTGRRRLRLQTQANMARRAIAQRQGGNMNAGMVLRIALKALRVNKLRSSLTMLGMIIGVAAVIAMLAIGGGAQERVREQLKNLGSNLMLIIPGSTTASGVRLGAGAAQTLTEDDAQAIAREVEGVVVRRRPTAASGQMIAGNTNWSTQYLRHDQRIHESARLAARVRAALRTAGDQRRRQSRADRPERGEAAVRRCRSGRPADPHPQSPVHHHRRAGEQGPEHDGKDQDDIILVPMATARNRVFGKPQGKLRRVGTISVKCATART